MFKLGDLSSQIPFKMVENPWLFPLEKINPQDLPWRNLMQVNFQVKQSLLDEYNLFSWAVGTWVEAPREVTLGQVFHLCIQERRPRKDLKTIQDMGDEYDGQPQFCWIFWIKLKWYDPSTWFRKPRYLNPDLSIEHNKIRSSDVVIARRIPGSGKKQSSIDYKGMIGDDPEKTIIIQR